MKTIKIINALHIEDGVKAKTKNGKFQTVHLQQGDLDGACTVYSTMMVLILINEVKYSDIKFSGNEYDNRYSIERLKKEFFEIKGLHREGAYLFNDQYDNITNMLKRSYGSKVFVDHIDYKKYDILEKIKEVIDMDQPVLISIAYKGGGAHSLVAIGMECDENNEPTKILCLDPGCPTPKFTYWNSVIDLDQKQNSRIYKYSYITEFGKSDYVQLQDILIISKR